MDRRAELVLTRARELQRKGPLAGHAWNETGSAVGEVTKSSTSALTSKQRDQLLKRAEDELLKEGAIAHVDQS